MQLFTNIKRSVYDPSFYSELESKPLSFSFKYIFSFAAVFGLLIMLQFAIFGLPEFLSTLKKAGPFVTNAYPADLVLTLTDGELSTNMEEPYVLPGFEGMAMDVWDEGDNPKHVLVIDTNVSPSVEYLEEYDTLVLLTKKHLLYQDEQGKITVQPFDELPDGELDKEAVDALIAKYLPYVYVLVPIVFVGLFLVAFLFVGFQLVYLLLAALFIMLVAKTRNTQLGYAKAYQAGMHLMTLPIVFVWFSPVSFPFMFTLMLLVLAMLNLEKKAPEATE